MVRVSLSLLQVLPEMDFRMFVLACILFLTDLPCAQSILGRVICCLPLTRYSCVLTFLVQVVKSVAADFPGEISS